MRIVDCHTHCFPDAVAGRAVQRLAEAYAIVPCADATVSGLTRQMDEAGIALSVNLPVATSPQQVPSINDWAAGLGTARLISFGAMHPEFPEIASEMRRMKGMGLAGVKLQPNWQGFRPDDPRVFPLYEAAGEAGLILYFHSGEEITPDADVPATPERIAQVHRLFPGLIIVAAHMGGHRMWDRVKRCLLGSGVYFDTSYCLPADLPDKRLVRMIRDHGADRVLFGSDSPCGSAGDSVRRLLSLALTADELEAVAWRNAARLLGLSEENARD